MFVTFFFLPIYAPHQQSILHRFAHCSIGGVNISKMDETQSPIVVQTQSPSLFVDIHVQWRTVLCLHPKARTGNAMKALFRFTILLFLNFS